MRVVFFQRKRRPNGNYSIESIFDRLRKNLPKDVEAVVAVSKYESNGIFKRVYNILEAAHRQRLGDVYHVTGDIHFLTYLLKKDKTILTIHDLGILAARSGIRRLLIKYFWFILPVKKAAAVSVISQSTKEELLKVVNCRPNKVFLIPISISERFVPSKKEFNHIRPVLLQIGSAPNKNLRRLIEAIKEIPCKLEIVGQLSGQIIQQLKEFKIEYENFINLSEDELIERYNNCDIVTFVSIYEGFGMPILEANAVGRPLITGNILSMPEIAGEAACLVDPFDVDSISEGMIKIITDEKYRNDLIEKGFENIRRFNPDDIIIKYLSLYKKIAQ